LVWGFFSSLGNLLSPQEATSEKNTKPILLWLSIFCDYSNEKEHLKKVLQNNYSEEVKCGCLRINIVPGNIREYYHCTGTVAATTALFLAPGSPFFPQGVVSVCPYPSTTLWRRGHQTPESLADVG